MSYSGLVIIKKIEEANQYLKKLDQEFDVTVKAYCSNDIVNAVLSSKEQLASEAGISCDFQIDFTEPPQMEDTWRSRMKKIHLQ